MTGTAGQHRSALRLHAGEHRLEGSWAHATLPGGATSARTPSDRLLPHRRRRPARRGRRKITVTSDTAGEGTAAAVGHLGHAVRPRHQGPDPHPDLDWQPRRRPGVGRLADAFGHIAVIRSRTISSPSRSPCTRTACCTRCRARSARSRSRRRPATSRRSSGPSPAPIEAPVDDPNPTPDLRAHAALPGQLARLDRRPVQRGRREVHLQPGQRHPDPARRVGTDGYIGVLISNRKPDRRDRPRSRYRRQQRLLGPVRGGSAHAVPDARRHCRRQHRLVPRARTRSTPGMTYTDRNGILAYDAGLSVLALSGNDEELHLPHVRRTAGPVPGRSHGPPRSRDRRS